MVFFAFFVLFFVILVIFSVIVILVFVIGEVFVNFQLQCVCALWPFLLVCFACFPPPPAAPVNNLIRKQALQ